MTMTEPKTIIDFDAEDLKHIEYVRNLLVTLDQQIDDFYGDGVGFSFNLSDEFTKKTVNLLDEIQDLWEQMEYWEQKR